MTSAKVAHRAATMRSLWRLIETYHAPVYFAPEQEHVYNAIGLRNLTTAYFATRAAPLGLVNSRVVSACLFAFAHAKVAQHLPAAWRHASPMESLGARLEVFDLACTRMLGTLAAEPAVRACGRLLADLVAGTACNGRPVFAANASTPRPPSGHLELFWAATALREFRGDAHFVALQSAGVTPVESHVIMSTLGLVPADQVAFMGWSAQERGQAVVTLQDRGWFTDAGRLSKEGRRHRGMIEHETDRLSAEALMPLGEDGTAEATYALSTIAAKFITAGAVPFPNRTGVAPVAELGVLR